MKKVIKCRRTWKQWYCPRPSKIWCFILSDFDSVRTIIFSLRFIFFQYLERRSLRNWNLFLLNFYNFRLVSSYEFYFINFCTFYLQCFSFCKIREQQPKNVCVIISARPIRNQGKIFLFRLYDRPMTVSSFKRHNLWPDINAVEHRKILATIFNASMENDNDIHLLYTFLILAFIINKKLNEN